MASFGSFINNPLCNHNNYRLLDYLKVSFPSSLILQFLFTFVLPFWSLLLFRLFQFWINKKFLLESRTLSLYIFWKFVKLSQESILKSRDTHKWTWPRILKTLRFFLVFVSIEQVMIILFVIFWVMLLSKAYHTPLVTFELYQFLNNFLINFSVIFKNWCCYFVTLLSLIYENWLFILLFFKLLNKNFLLND